MKKPERSSRDSCQSGLESGSQAVATDVVEVVDEDSRVAHVQAEVPIGAVQKTR